MIIDNKILSLRLLHCLILKVLKESFSVLNRERNNVAHGINSTLSFNDMKNRFSEAIRVIEILDSVMV